MEQVVANAGGKSDTVVVATELPEGWKMEGVFGAPATGTADLFLETVGVGLLIAGVVLLVVMRRVNG